MQFNRFSHNTASFGFSVLAVASLAACSSVPPTSQPQFQDNLQAKVEEARVSTPPSVVFRAGDTYASVFRALGLLDGNNYIVEGDSTLALSGDSTPVLKAEDAVNYFFAHGQTVTMTPMDGTKYVRVKIGKSPTKGMLKASVGCDVNLAGVVPMGAVVSTIANKAGLELRYVDTGASAYAGVMYPVSYLGSCANALEYMARKADLAVAFSENGVEFRMMDTAAVDIGIPLRDRKIALDILADGRISGSGSNTSGVQSNGYQSNSTSTNNSGVSAGGSKSLQSTYVTNYLSSIRNILDSTRSPFGTWNYVPETGQVFIRDRAESVAATKSNLNRLAQAFYGRYEVTLTLYRMTSTKDRQVSGSIARAINNNLAISFGNPAASLASSTLGINYDSTISGGKTKSVIQLLSEFGHVETLDSFSLTLQSGIPQTLKVAHNTEYIRNVSTTSTGTVGATTSSIEQANATDGSFLTMQARQAEVGKIAIDFGAFINQLDGFDTTETPSSRVKSQRGFERTFDTMAVVDDGIPYVTSIISQKTRSGNTQTLPGAEGAPGALGLVVPAIAGSKTDAEGNSYIVVMVEARKR